MIPDDLRAEATRLAVLRRLGPALRHEVTGLMQPVAMAAALLDRRLGATPVDLPRLRDEAQRLADCARRAVQSSLHGLGWLVPPASQAVPLADAVQEVLGLLTTPLRLDGFRVQAPTPSQLPAACVSQRAVRSLLPASLWWLTEQAPAPATVQFQVDRTPGWVHLLLRRAATESAQAPAPAQADTASPPGPAPLEWASVQALARAEGCTLEKKGQALELGLPCAER